MLGVRPGEIAAHGAVSEHVVEAMVAGAALAAASELAVAVSGIAGPGGAAPGKPVGTVWFAWRAPDLMRTRLERFDGDREAVRRQSVAVALDGLIAVYEASG
jgi:nicotinamide-nucleotide amidase